MENIQNTYKNHADNLFNKSTLKSIRFWKAIKPFLKTLNFLKSSVEGFKNKLLNKLLGPCVRGKPDG